MAPDYRPDTFKCIFCVRATTDCSGLPFAGMPIERETRTATIVKCTEYQADRNHPMQPVRPAIQEPGARTCLTD